jgi:hypothetical protein
MVTNGPQQPDDFGPSMTVAVMVLAEVTTENSHSYLYLHEDTQNAFRVG